jgi:acetyl-CoA acyltransferase
MANRRVAIVAGCRTPFARAGTVFRDLTAVDLGRVCVRELIERTEVDPASIGAVVMGQVVPSVKAPNLGREVALGAGLPKSVPAHTVNRACASSNQAIADVATAILFGHVEAGIAGGAESLSDVPILHSRRMAQILVEAQRAKSLEAPGRSPRRSDRGTSCR